jgi:hypothetical protein
LFSRTMRLTVAEGMSRCPASVRALQRVSPLGRRLADHFNRKCCNFEVTPWLAGRMLLLASSDCGLFKWRQFEPEVILMALRWYLRFSLSYLDVEELLTERGLSVDHVTVWRWVQRYASELKRRLRKRLKATNSTLGGWMRPTSA